ncbi:MAG: transposase, partial [Bacteroidetes bacterium]
MSEAWKIRDQHALYFLTMRVVFWLDVFTRQAYRDIIIESLQYCREKKHLEVFAYVVMSNHLHLIV